MREVRIATSVPTLRTREALAKRLRVAPEKIAEILDFLTQTGLVHENNGEYSLSSKSMLLENDDLLAKHHTNWRVHAISSLERLELKDLHLSFIVSLSRKDAEAIKSIFLEAVERLDAKVATSPEETLYSFCMDFYEV